MSTKEDKIKLLQSMLAGKPTKESEAIRTKTEIFEGRAEYNPDILQERTNHVPSANDLVISREELLLANTGTQALPAVSEADALALFSGKKIAAKGVDLDHIKRLNDTMIGKVVKEEPDPYSFDPNPVNNEVDNFDSALRQREDKLRQKLDAAKKTPTNINVGNKTLLNETVRPQNTNEAIVNLVEEIVYKVLGEILQEANEDARSKDRIKAMIGEAILFNKLKKAVLNSSKK